MVTAPRRRPQARPDAKTAAMARPALAVPSLADWKYLLLIRGAAFERHWRTCTQCNPALRTGDSDGNCSHGVFLAMRADQAQEHIDALGQLLADPGTPPGSLF